MCHYLVKVIQWGNTKKYDIPKEIMQMCLICDKDLC